MKKIELNPISSNENCIDWLTGQKTLSVTFSQKKFVNKIRRLAEKCPEEVHILAENEDGSIFAHIPYSYLKISKPRQISEEQRQKASERLRKYRSEKK